MIRRIHFNNRFTLKGGMIKLISYYIYYTIYPLTNSKYAPLLSSPSISNFPQQENVEKGNRKTSVTRSLSYIKTLFCKLSKTLLRNVNNTLRLSAFFRQGKQAVRLSGSSNLSRKNKLIGLIDLIHLYLRAYKSIKKVNKLTVGAFKSFTRAVKTLKRKEK